MDMELDERKFMILKAIIDDYIMTAVPVGSRTISRKSGVHFSPATIRNEMSDLEELGYLDQPHTSAGRIPSAKAYRLYVDSLMKVAEPSEQDVRLIREHLSYRSHQMEQVIRYAAQVLSETTRYTAVVAAPKALQQKVRRIQLVPVSENTAMLIVVTADNMVKDTVVRVPEGLTPDHLYAISNLLTEQLAGHALGETRADFAELVEGLNRHRELMDQVLSALQKHGEETEAPIAVGGRSNLLSYPEYSDVTKAQHFLSALESREKLYPLLKAKGGVEFTVRIGPENEIKEFSDCSVITASYQVGDGSSGTFGIIGPTRMDYARVVSVMNYMAKMLGELLGRDG